MTTALVLLADEGLVAVPWAARVAAAHADALTILCVAADPAPQCDPVNRDQPDESSPELVLGACRAAADLGDATVIDCRGPDRRRAILRAIASRRIDRLILHTELDDADANRTLVARVMRAAPCDVIILAAGALAGETPQRIVIPQLDGDASHAITACARLLGDGSPPVTVIPDPKRLARSRRVYRKAIEELAPGARVRCTQAEPPAAPLTAALRELIQPGDLIVADAERQKRMARLLAPLKAARRASPELPFAVAVTRAENAAGPGWAGREVRRFRRFLPELERDARKELYERIEAGGKVSTDFVVMLSLSAAIAALGLVQSSAAVIIGAMLVAPLMTPLVAAGMALTQANVRLFRSALQAMAVGVAGAIIVSLAVGMLAPWPDLSAEVVARGNPNLFDLAIALLSGAAAAYALARPGLAGTLVGVAIAVALVPPLAAVSIAVTHQDYRIALGAAVLFTTNLFAIILGAALVFRFFGLAGARRVDGAPRWVRGAVAMLLVGAAVTTAPLVHNLATEMRHGVNRPYARPLQAALRAAILERAARSSGVEIVLMAESDIEHGFGVEIILAADNADAELIEDIHALIRRHMGEDTPARVLTLRAASFVAD